MRASVVAALLAITIATSARADIVTRAAGGAGGGGSGSAAPSAMENDLIAWAGEPKAITLPELLQNAVRQAPTLQTAKIDIQIADAQIAQTWERHAWHLQAQGTLNRTLTFFLGEQNTS